MPLCTSSKRALWLIVFNLCFTLLVRSSFRRGRGWGRPLAPLDYILPPGVQQTDTGLCLLFFMTTHFAPVGSTSNERLFVCPGAQSWWCCSCHLMEGSKGHLPQSPCLCLRGAVRLIGRTDCGCVCTISKTLCSAGSSRVGRYECSVYSTKLLLQCAIIFGATVNFMFTLTVFLFSWIFALPD